MIELTASDRLKRAAALAAVAEVRDGMTIGLGTGSTAAFAIVAIGERVANGLVIRAVATSDRTAAAAMATGIAVIDLPASGMIDLCIDGVDEIDPALRAIKGAGGAMLREKVVAAAATRMIAIADATKRVDRLGARPVPIEALALARPLIERQVIALGGEPRLRITPAGDPVHTDQGNPILDCAFATIDDPAKLAAALAAIPGVLGHGLFVDEIDALYLGTEAGVARSERPHDPLSSVSTHP